MPEAIQPQEELQEPVGVVTPQLAEEPAELELGAEPGPQKEIPKRTYTQEEWSKRESEKDKEIAKIREHLAQLNLQAEIERMEKAEIEAKDSDLKEVDEGIITKSEASKREQLRASQRKTEMTVAQQTEMLRQMRQQTERYGKLLAAQDFGKEYELTREQIAELLNDADIKTPGDMRAKAATFALERAQKELKKSQKPPKYDQGQSGGKESPREKTLKGRYPTMFKK